MAADEIIARLKKILALSQWGEGGERENASEMLNRLLLAHGLSMADLATNSNKKTTRRLTYSSEIERRLLLQIIGTVDGSKGEYSRIRRQGRLVKKIEVELTDAQYMEVDIAFSAYRRQLAIEQERLFLAFIHRHELFPPDAPPPSGPPVSARDVAALRSMMAGMEHVTVPRALLTDER